MEVTVAAVYVGFLLLAAKVAEEFMERIGFPSFLGAILAGVILGEGVLGIVPSEAMERAAILFMIGINFTLFLAGVEELSNPAMLMPTRQELLYGILLLGLPTLTAFSLLYYIGLEASTAVGLALILAIVSVGPLVKILMAKGGIGNREISILRTALLSELGGLVIFNAVATQGFNLLRLLESAVFVGFILFIGRHYLDDVLMAVERYVAAREAPFAIVIALIVTASYIAEIMGFNAAVTALIFGAFLSEYMMQRPLYLERIRALTYGLLEPLFFIGIGLQATRVDIVSLAYASAFFTAVSAPKLYIAWLQGLQGRELLAFLAKGGVDAALLSTMLQTGRIGGQLYTATLVAILLSAVSASASARITERAPEVPRLRVKDLPLDRDIVREDTYADYAAEIVSKRGAAVVVDENLHPVGYIVAEDFVGISSELLSHIPVKFLLRMEVPVVRADTTVAELLSDPSILHEPIIAVVNDRGEIIGTLNARKLLHVLLHPKHGRLEAKEGGET
ncbi:cation:proton antiporter [Hyperthermus butylicus]|nr:cation:proton antiporter [Hyperthermus butylicus]